MHKLRAAMAQWIRLRLPSCSPGFKSKAHHPRYFQYVFELLREKDENKQKRGRYWSIF